MHGNIAAWACPCRFLLHTVPNPSAIVASPTTLWSRHDLSILQTPQGSGQAMAPQQTEEEAISPWQT